MRYIIHTRTYGYVNFNLYIMEHKDLKRIKRGQSGPKEYIIAKETAFPNLEGLLMKVASPR